MSLKKRPWVAPDPGASRCLIIIGNIIVAVIITILVIIVVILTIRMSLMIITISAVMNYIHHHC